jgi:tetratricopeptide (TPR) repeat protein
MEAYQQQDYQQSLALFQSLREDHPFDGFILRYTALSAMQLGDYYIAEQALEQCLTIDLPASDRIAAQWYLALVYLRLDRQAEGQNLLQDLVASGNGMYATQARKLLEELK